MEQNILIPKVMDAIRLSELRNSPKFMGFLSPEEYSEVSVAVKNPSLTFFGGYDEAERKMLGVLPDYLLNNTDIFPITIIGIYFPKGKTLSHRDVLGTFMSTGVKRSFIGDILFTQNCGIVFVSKEIAEYLVSEVKKIKNMGVELKILPNLASAGEVLAPKTQEVSFTVSSPRLDAVISSLVGISRKSAEEIIADGLVLVNSLVVSKPTLKIKTGDKITVRKKGKFVIKNMGQFSKKGREIIVAEKYI